MMAKTRQRRRITVGCLAAASFSNLYTQLPTTKLPVNLIHTTNTFIMPNHIEANVVIYCGFWPKAVPIRGIMVLMPIQIYKRFGAYAVRHFTKCHIILNSRICFRLLGNLFGTLALSH